MSAGWWTARITIRLDILLAAGLIIAATVAVATYLFASSVADDRIPLSEIEEIARAWTEENIGGIAGDIIVDFIVSESNGERPDLYSEYLNDRIDRIALATTWTYCPVASVSEEPYEVTATASTRLHEVVPFGSLTDSSGAEVPTEPDDFTSIATLPFLLTVDMDSKSVTYWRALTEQGSHFVDLNIEKLPKSQR